MRRLLHAGGLIVVLLALGCHHEVEMIPLIERTIYITDKFYDVQALGPERAIVVGYGGKIIETTDGGRNWTRRESGVEDALYAVRFPGNGDSGWIVGQDGLALRSEDGGKTWNKQESNATFKDSDGTQKRAYLFGLDALDKDHAWAVGDRSMLVSTSDGGKTWRGRKVAMDVDLSGGEQLAAADPIFYDVKFTDLQHGWIVGEFGKIMHTSDGGETWHEQEKSLMEGTAIFDALDLPTLFGVYMKNEQEGLAAGLEGHLARTADGGQRWTFENAEVDVPLVDPMFKAIELTDGTGWACGSAGEVLKKLPGETAWKRAKIGQDILTWLRSINFAPDAKHGWMVGGYGLIFKTTDGGKTWTPSQG
jgi:photosystem II stability/assembly factor-like uncharacterized protein